MRLRIHRKQTVLEPVSSEDNLDNSLSNVDFFSDSDGIEQKKRKKVNTIS